MVALLKAENVLQIEDFKYPEGGMFATLQKTQKGMFQKFYHMKQMPFIYENKQNLDDFYITQSVFDGKSRKKINLKYFNHAWVDIDYYNVPVLLGLSKDQVVGQIIDFIRDEAIPFPTSIIDSGKGIYLKWAFSSYIQKQAGRKLEALNKALIKKFSHFGADPVAFDVSRVLRVVGSINTKTGTAVRIIHQTSEFHDFEMFCDEVFEPYEASSEAKRCEVVSYKSEKAKRRVISAGNFTRQDFAWKVLCDIESLIKARFGGATVPERYRDLYGFTGACQIATALADDKAVDVKQEILTWAKQWLACSYVDDEFQHYLSSLLDRVSRHRRGEKVEFRGKLITPVYTYKKDTLIDKLKVESSEMSGLNLNVLIDTRTKYERKNLKRRKTNNIELIRAAVGRIIANGGDATVDAIAAEAGVSKSTVIRNVDNLL